MNREFEQLLDKVRREGGEIRSDSREVGKGDIFVAVPGVNADGARFIPPAVEAGASTIVCLPGGAEAEAARAAGCTVVHHDDPREALWRLAEARWHTGSLPLRVLGVTGTNGKTTSAYLLEHLFTATGHKVGVLGTVSYRWPGHCEAAPLTTPDPLRVHAMLAAMAQAGVDIAVMEVSSHALEQQRVCGVPFAGASFSNLTQDHLDFHQDMESYFRAKSRLFLELPRADKVMAINGDDPWGRRLLELCPRALSFGLQKALPQQRHLIQTVGRVDGGLSRLFPPAAQQLGEGLNFSPFPKDLPTVDVGEETVSGADIQNDKTEIQKKARDGAPEEPASLPLRLTAQRQIGLHPILHSRSTSHCFMRDPKAQQREITARRMAQPLLPTAPAGNHQAAARISGTTDHLPPKDRTAQVPATTPRPRK